MGGDTPNHIKLIYRTWNNRYFWVIFWMDLSGMDFLVLVSTGPEHPQTNHHPTGVLNTAQMDLNGISMVICWVFQFVDFLLALTKTGSLTAHRRILNRILWNPFRGLASTQIFQPSDEFWWNLKKIAYIQRSNIIVLNPWICFHIMCFMAVPTLAGGWNSWLRDCMTISQHAVIRIYMHIMESCLCVCRSVYWFQCVNTNSNKSSICTCSCL